MLKQQKKTHTIKNLKKKKRGGGLRLASIVLYFPHQLSKHLYPKNMYTSNVYKSYTFLTPVGDRGSIPGRVRPKSLKQVLIAECSVTGVSVMSSQRWPYKRMSRITVGVAREGKLGVQCPRVRAWVKICRPSSEMVTSRYEWKILEWDGKPQTNKPPTKDHAKESEHFTIFTFSVHYQFILLALYEEKFIFTKWKIPPY